MVINHKIKPGRTISEQQQLILQILGPLNPSDRLYVDLGSELKDLYKLSEKNRPLEKPEYRPWVEVREVIDHPGKLKDSRFFHREDMLKFDKEPYGRRSWMRCDPSELMIKSLEYCHARKQAHYEREKELLWGEEYEIYKQSAYYLYKRQRNDVNSLIWHSACLDDEWYNPFSVLGPNYSLYQIFFEDFEFPEITGKFLGNDMNGNYKLKHLLPMFEFDNKLRVGQKAFKSYTEMHSYVERKMQFLLKHRKLINQL